jgi:hypothetical protein
LFKLNFFGPNWISSELGTFAFGLPGEFAGFALLGMLMVVTGGHVHWVHMLGHPLSFAPSHCSPFSIVLLPQVASTGAATSWSARIAGTTRSRVIVTSH